MCVAFIHRGAHAGTVGVESVPLCARTAVLQRVKDRGALVARRSIPLIAARAVATGEAVAAHRHCVPSAVVVAGAREVACGVRTIVASAALATVVGGVVTNGADAARRARPLVPARAVAVGEQARDVCCVVGAVLGRCADAVAPWVVVVPVGTHATVSRCVEVGGADAAIVRCPLVSATACAAAEGIPADTSRVAAAVGLCGAREVA